LTVMLSVSKQLRRCSDLGQATGVVDRVPALMLETLKDFAACQGPQSSVGDIWSGHPFLLLCELLAVVVAEPEPACPQANW